MRFEIDIEGTSPLIMHSTRGMDKSNEDVIKISELNAKRGTSKTIADEQRVAQLETQLALWLDESGKITIPPQALRSCIETAARKLKHGPLVREGLIVEFGVDFDHTVEGDTIEEIAANAMFTTDVVVQRSRVLRSRPKFDRWTARFVVDCDDSLIDKPKLVQWMDIAGRRIGLGDWRPAKSGVFGRFSTTSIEELKPPKK